MFFKAPRKISSLNAKIPIQLWQFQPLTLTPHFIRYLLPSTLNDNLKQTPHSCFQASSTKLLTLQRSPNNDKITKLSHYWWRLRNWLNLDFEFILLSETLEMWKFRYVFTICVFIKSFGFRPILSHVCMTLTEPFPNELLFVYLGHRLTHKIRSLVRGFSFAFWTNWYLIDKIFM